MSFLELAKERYSCRSLTDKPVEQEKIDQIIEAGRIAPTAKNAQPVKIWVFQSEEALAKVRQCTPMTFAQVAPVIFVIGAKPDAEGVFVRPFDQANFADVDAGIVATHMMLEIADLGLGTTWVGFFDPIKLAELFPEMKGYHLDAMFPVGYPAEDAAPAPRHTEYKPFDEMVKIL